MRAGHCVINTDNTRDGKNKSVSTFLELITVEQVTLNQTITEINTKLQPR